MKLASLYENLATNDLLKASGVRSFYKLGQNQPADTYPLKKMQDPNYPERLPDQSTQPGSKMMPRRSGAQDTPMKPRHRIFFNSPPEGRSTKPGFNQPGDRIGSAPRVDEPAERSAPIGVWGRRPGVKDI